MLQRQETVQEEPLPSTRSEDVTQKFCTFVLYLISKVFTVFFYVFVSIKSHNYLKIVRL